MAKFTVTVNERWVRTFEIEIPNDSPQMTLCYQNLQDHLRELADKKTEDDGFEYVDTEDKSLWTCRNSEGIEI